MRYRSRFLRLVVLLSLESKSSLVLAGGTGSVVWADTLRICSLNVIAFLFADLRRATCISALHFYKPSTLRSFNPSTLLSFDASLS